MDTITHALSGALLARATAPEPGTADALPVGRRVIVGTLAAAFPDGDYVFNLVSPLMYLQQHRGATHSLVMLPLWALLLAWLVSRLDRGRYRWRAYAPVIAFGIGIHIAGDLITSFGTMIWWPLSDLRVAWNTTFIIDPWFTGIILAGLVASALWRSRWPAAGGLAVLVAYVLGQAMLQGEARAIGREHARAAGLADAVVTAQPRPPFPTHWMVVVATPDRYDYALISLTRKKRRPPLLPDAGFFARVSAPYQPARDAEWVSVPRYGTSAQQALARDAWKAPVLGFYRWFTAYPMTYRVDHKGDATCVWFQDLRFLTPGRTKWPFRYGACRSGSGPWRAFELAAEGDRIPVP